MFNKKSNLWILLLLVSQSFFSKPSKAEPLIATLKCTFEVGEISLLMVGENIKVFKTIRGCEDQPSLMNRWKLDQTNLNAILSLNNDCGITLLKESRPNIQSRTGKNNTILSFVTIGEEKYSGVCKLKYLEKSKKQTDEEQSASGGGVASGGNKKE